MPLPAKPGSQTAKFKMLFKKHNTSSEFICHINGAVYGSPHKIKDGATSVKNLYLCGTDQGFLGSVGSMLSGVSMANVHCLQE